jgi:hypothetical protein
VVVKHPHLDVILIAFNILLKLERNDISNTDLISSTKKVKCDAMNLEYLGFIPQ